MKAAGCYKALPLQKVLCTLCPKRCKIRNQHAGECRVRVNEGGILYNAAWGKISKQALEPVEKVPLMHFFPGTSAFSVGFFGCSFSCSFCNEWKVSQQAGDGLTTLEPKQLVAEVVKNAAKVLAFKFNEPTVHFEYIQEVAKLAKTAGLRVVLHTNGYVAEEPWRILLEDIDAAVVDLKSVDETFYRQVCSGQVSPVLRSLRLAYEKVWTEVTALLIPKLTDTRRCVETMVRSVAGISADIPLHFSAFEPSFRLTHLDRTSVEILRAARATAKENLKFVYFSSDSGENEHGLYCSSCGMLLVERTGRQVRVAMQKGRCVACGKKIPGVFPEENEEEG